MPDDNQADDVGNNKGENDMSNNTNAEPPTARDLRHLLFAVEDQSMTVNDLRRLLFDEEQDAPLTATDVRRVTRTR